ncbi:G-type lectin S-receptor-like serine/threonine-protein kinase B120 [Apostasia shenzhenica]|uniref:Receptor-like serine/threonine-protein kinase n=1 Tax=Apostasia shenzhenica TaxID=1088818 RepID=A0A2I0BFH8_9ASPA|nr:G-type lectin S-receptor-like serine/threonine-protein kinase B120 [Apostasia shenzhenica]
MGCSGDFRWWVLIVILASLPSPSSSRAATTLTLAEPIADGDTLVSPGGIFRLGFFSPDGSGNRYVGVWHGDDFSINNIVWVANRDSPLPDSAGSIAISGEGNLVVLDGRRRVFWSSNATFLSSNSTAELSDFGNLMLNFSGAAGWDSFSHPTDTYLPGMKISFRLNPKSNQVLTSWRTPSDPAPGNFSLGVDPSAQLFIWDTAGEPRWRSGVWNGQVFIGIPGMMFPAAYGFTLSNFIEGNTVFYYTGFNSSHRWVLSPAGTVKHLVFSATTKEWVNLWEAPATECERYNKCGRYGSCSNGDNPICSCLKGFIPRLIEEWKRGNWTGGCVRKTPLKCGGGGSDSDRFYLLQGVKLPDLAETITKRELVNVSACGDVCLRNCSCKAYSFVDAIGCMTWGVDLADVNVFSAGGNDLYLRLAASEFLVADEKKKTMAVYLIVIIVLAGASAFGCLMCFFIWRKKKRRIKKEFHEQNRGQEEAEELSDVIEIQKQEDDRKSNELPVFSFSAILAATGGFSQSNFLGKGGFGPVYKGKLHGGQEIAVKRLSRNSGQGMEEFKNEVILIAKLQHRNLVRLLGFCTEKEDQILVYEYMPNKSLDAFLFDPSKKALLNWKTRYAIIKGIARGLVYLHRDSRLRIIHRDLKVSNILLDDEMNPKISDFGLARIFRKDDIETSTRRVVGTYGYMSPEYAMHGIFSVKSDVYSFGVLLLEIVTGKRNSTYNSDADLYLLAFAWKMWIEQNVIELVDQTIRDSCSVEEIKRCINVGLLCVQDKANDRPTMPSVIMMLESGIIAQLMPKQPTFAFDAYLSDTGQSLSSDNRDSSNNASSITILTEGNET